MYAVGIGNAIEEELREIASDPPDKHLFYAENFSAMGEITEKLQKRICEGLKDHQDFPESLFHSADSYSEEPEAATLSITDVLACSNFAVHHKYLFEEKQLRSTSSGKPSEDTKELCKCENLLTFQNSATAAVRKLTQQLGEMSKIMEALENQLRYR